MVSKLAELCKVITFHQNLTAGIFCECRVHTLAMPVVSELAELYNGSDAAAIACLNSKLAVEKLYSSHLEETRQAVQQKVCGGKGWGAGVEQLYLYCLCMEETRKAVQQKVWEESVYGDCRVALLKELWLKYPSALLHTLPSCGAIALCNLCIIPTPFSCRWLRLSRKFG